MMIKVRRLGHTTFETPDLEKQIDYYTQIAGLAVVGKERDRVFLSARAGSLAIELRRGAARRCTSLSFEVAQNEDFTDMQRRLTADGIKSDIRSDSIPGTPKVLAFEDPKGTSIEIFTEWSALGHDQAVPGIGPLKLGHVAFYVSDPKAMAEFYGRVLGFKVSDWINDFFVFMRCNADHHAVNFITGQNVGMHHMAFELRDFSHLQVACDTFGQKKIPIIWGPVRLGPGHNVATFHRNTDDWVVEFYIELDQMKDDELGYYDPRPWHEDKPQRPKVWAQHAAAYIWGPPPTPDFFRGREVKTD
jgi:catechol 2,3-dioxygenase-like lactoylglutathione lyase family enzyme